MIHAIALACVAFAPSGEPEVAPAVPIGRWPNGSAFAAAVSADGQTGWFGSGGTVIVARLGALDQPAEVLAEVPTEGFVFALAEDGGDLFIAGSRAGLLRIDVREPGRPGAAERVGAAGDVCFDVAVRGDLIAIADGSAGAAFFRRTTAGVQLLGRVAVGTDRARGVALGDGFALVAAGTAGVARIDLADPGAPRLERLVATAGTARSVALLEGGRHALVGADEAGLVLCDAASLEVARTARFALPATDRSGESSAAGASYAVGRVRVRGTVGYACLDGSPVGDQISPFTPEFGAYRGEPRLDPRSAVALVGLGPDESGVPALAELARADRPREREYLHWVRDVVPVAGGFLAVDFFGGVYAFQRMQAPRAPTGGTRFAEVARTLDTRAGAIDMALSPTDPRIVYVSSDVGALQVFDVSDPARPRRIARETRIGGTFCAAAARREKGPDGQEVAVDYVFVNDFFRVRIARVDPRDPAAMEVLDPLWITIPEAVRGNEAFSHFGLTPRSYRVRVEGDALDVVATNTIFGWQRFSIEKVLACTERGNIYAARRGHPPEMARSCEPEWRAVTSPEAVADAAALFADKPRAGGAMTLHAQGSQVILGCGPRPAGGRGGATGAPVDGSLQLFDLADPVVEDARLGRLRFPRASKVIDGAGILIGIDRRGDLLFVADSNGFVRLVDVADAAGQPLVPRARTWENVGPAGRDSVFDVLLDGDRLHVAAWSRGYVCLDAREAAGDRFLTPLSELDTAGLPISLAKTAGGSLLVAEHCIGLLVLP